MNSELNIELYRLFRTWNPLELPDDDALQDPEVYMCMECVHHYELSTDISKSIQQGYINAFDEVIELDEIEQITHKALQLKSLYKDNE